jgi:hypothetical protein
VGSPFAAIHFVPSVHSSKTIIEFTQSIPLLVQVLEIAVFGLHEQLWCCGPRKRVGSSAFVNTLKVSIELFEPTTLGLLFLWLEDPVTPLLPTQMSGLLFPTGFCRDIGSHTVHPASARCPEPRLFGGRDGGLWEWPDSSCHSLVGSFKIEFFFFSSSSGSFGEGLC